MNCFRTASAVAGVLACFALLPGCITAPEIVLFDRATALEHQAAGSFAELERKLVREGIAARPVPLTADDLQALGIQPPPLVDEIDLTEADRVDALVAQHCIGEARDGTLADTHDTCRVSADQVAARTLIDRVNRARQQLWHWMHARQPKSAPAELRRSWRQTHLLGVVCGGWVQKDDGSWEAKQC
jgi:hypothetical protein